MSLASGSSQSEPESEPETSQPLRQLYSTSFQPLSLLHFLSLFLLHHHLSQHSTLSLRVRPLHRILRRPSFATPSDRYQVCAYPPLRTCGWEQSSICRAGSSLAFHEPHSYSFVCLRTTALLCVKRPLSPQRWTCWQSLHWWHARKSNHHVLQFHRYALLSSY